MKILLFFFLLIAFFFLIGCGGCYETMIVPNYEKSVLITPYGEIPIKRPSDVSVPSDRYDGKPYEKPGLLESERGIFRIRVGGRSFKEGMDVSIFVSTPRENLGIQVDNAVMTLIQRKMSSLFFLQEQSVIEKDNYNTHFFHYRVLFDNKINIGDSFEAFFPFIVNGEKYKYSFSGKYAKIKKKVPCLGFPGSP